MTTARKRIVCIILVLSSLLSLTGCKRDGKDTSSGKNSTTPQAILTQEQNEYLQAHLAYLETLEYETILRSPGGFATALSGNLENAGMGFMNNLWNSLNALSGNSGQAKQKDAYQSVVADLMQSTGSSQFFANSMDSHYMDAMVNALGQVRQVLDAAKRSTDLVQGDDLEKLENLLSDLEDFEDVMSTLHFKPTQEVQDRISEMLKKVNTQFQADYIAKNKDLLKNISDSLTIGMEGMNFISHTISDMMNEVCFYRALDGASQEWEAAWQMIGSDLRSAYEKDSSSTRAKDLADCIDELLAGLRANRANEVSVFYQALVHSSATNLLYSSHTVAVEMFNGVMQTIPIVSQLRCGISVGVTISNWLGNTDDLTFYAQLMMYYGTLSESAFWVMAQIGDDLQKSKTYQQALLFDQAFHIYKTIQLSSLECSLEYSQSILSAPAKYYYSAGANQLKEDVVQIRKFYSEWDERLCHKLPQVLNNGGQVISYRDVVYYIRYSEDSIAEGGHIADFPRNPEATNQLIRRDAKGKETVLLKDAVYGNLYICNQRLIYQVNGKGWYHCSLQGKDAKPLGGSPVSVYNDASAMILRSGSQLIGTNLAGTTSGSIDIPQDARITGGYNEIAYYCLWNQDYAKNRVTCYFYWADMAQSTVGQTDSLTIDYRYDQPIFADYAVTKDGFYALIGFVGGRGGFFQNGSIYYLPSGGDTVQTLVDGEVSVSFMYLRQAKDKNRYLYYNNWDSDASIESVLYSNFYTENTQCVDLKTGNISGTVLPLCEEKAPFILDGNLYMMDGVSDEPLLLVSKAMVRQAGFGAWGRHDGGATYCLSADLVGNTCYVTIMDAVSSDKYTADSYYTGNYPGYTWKSIRFYAVDLETGDMTEIYSY